MSRIRNSAKNLAAGLVFALAAAAASFLAAPLLLRWLGSERLGAYKVLTDWIGHLTYLELGLGGALMAALAGKIGRGDRAAIARTLAAGLRGYCWVTLLQLIGGIALVVFLPQLIPLNFLSKSELRLAGAVALLPILITPLSVFRVLADARQRSYLNWTLLTGQVVIATGLSLWAAYRGWGLVGQSAAFATAQFPALLALSWHGTRSYRNAWQAIPEQADRKILGGLRWASFIHGMTERMGLVSDNIVIAWLLGPAAVVPFFLTQQLTALALSNLRGLGQATWAGLADLYTRGHEATLRMRLLELTGMVSGLGMAVLVPIAAYNESFVRMWVGPDLYAGNIVTGLACVNVLLWSVYSLWGWALLGAGHIRHWVPFGVISAVVTVAVSVPGTATLGIVGPLLGSTSGLVLITSWALPRVLHNAFKISPWALWRAVLVPVCWGLPFAIALRTIAVYQNPMGWPELVTAAGLSSAGGFVLWWRLSLGPEERLEWRSRLRDLAGF